MSTRKTNKSFTKRIKITKNGKVKSRKPGMNHYNAKESSAKKTNKSKPKSVSISKQTLDRFVPHGK